MWLTSRLTSQSTPVVRDCTRRTCRNCTRPWVAHAWMPVTDPASGKTYYWNTDTNETSWELPTSRDTDAPSAIIKDAAETTVDFPGMLEQLLVAYSADTQGGMGFWEAARTLRSSGVFDEPFMFDYLGERMKAAGTEERELLQRIQARLSNPLLRQAAPFE